jgi:hypothetical protein
MAGRVKTGDHRSGRAPKRRPPARSVGVAIAFLVAALAAPSVAGAAFSVGPSVHELTVRPGEAHVGSFQVNTRQDHGRFVIEIEDVLQRSDGGLVYSRPNRSRFSASSWIEVFPRAFTGQPSRVQPVEYRVRVPDGAEPGDHVASLTVKRLPPHGERGVTTIQAVSVRVTVRVAGRRREAVVIESLEAPGLAGRGPVRVRGRLRNTGNVRLNFDRRNRASVVLLDSDERVARLRLRGMLFPGQARDFELSLEDPPLAGRLEARATVKTRTGLVTREARVWMVPWRQAGALVLISTAALAVSSGRRRRRALAVTG